MICELETERLILKCIGYEDTDFYFKLYSSEEVNRFLYDAEPCHSAEDAKEWIKAYVASEPRDQESWIIVLKENNEKIGNCCFYCRNREAGTIEMGYALLPAYWRRGYSSEALTAIMQYAAEAMQVRKIYTRISADNLASIRTSEKMGFLRTGDTYYEVFHGREYLHEIYVYSV